jgi:linoleoyl-CoA desaturase
MEMYLKTVFMFALYFIPYLLMLTGVVSGAFSLLLSVIVMGLGLAGIGLSVMHDANHGAYSNKGWVNDLMGYSLNLVGANAFNWKIQHNVLHHSFTNVHDHDEDISPRGVLRLCPSTPWKRIHRFQFVYAWFLYGLMTIVWLFFKDFVRISRYSQSGLASKQKANVSQEWLILIGSKVVYVGYIFVIPLLFTPLLWWQIIVGILMMHFVAGFILAIIFQPAHVVDGTEFPVPDDSNKLDNCAVHQLLTTTNFGNKSRWFSWYVGGLNFQIEHHLFPNICHVHYRNIAGIVRETAKEFGLPYKSFNTFLGALRGHTRLLKRLGERPGRIALN